MAKVILIFDHISRSTTPKFYSSSLSLLIPSDIRNRHRTSLDTKIAFDYEFFRQTRSVFYQVNFIKFPIEIVYWATKWRNYHLLHTCKKNVEWIDNTG